MTPPSITRGAAAAQRGFSLLELLAVVVIIGLGLAIIGFGAGRNEPLQLRNSARTFANLTALVEEEAVLSREPWGVQIYREIDQDGGDDVIAYRFLHFAGEDGWKPAAPPETADGGRFPKGTQAILELEGAEQLIEPLQQAKGAEPTVWLAPGGEVTPFVLQLRLKGAGDGPTIRSDALGRIQLELHKDGEASK